MRHAKLPRPTGFPRFSSARCQPSRPSGGHSGGILRQVHRWRVPLALLANGALLVNQAAAQLSQITFEQPAFTPGQAVGISGTDGWLLLQGLAETSAAGSGYGGGQALRLPANAQTESWVTRQVTWNAQERTAFVDFRIKPSADPEGSLASFYCNGTQLAFQVPQGSSTGELWVFDGNDGAADPSLDPEQWLRSAGTFPLAAGGTTAAAYSRITLRHDYQRNIWDVFFDGKMLAANLRFEGRSTLDGIEFFGGAAGDTLVDDLSAQTQNMLFPDADKDGLPDAWETANGSNPNLYDRDNAKPGTSGSFLDAYMAALWPQLGGLNGNGNLIPPAAIPPLTILGEHQPVGAVKGSLAVGGDGAATYSVPIEVPKGTAGMEPKLALAYSSAGGNGIAGVGWNVTGLQRITRGPSSVAKDGNYDPVDFDDSDRFFLDGERLVCVGGTYGLAGSEYRTEIDSFARITLRGTAGQPGQWWTVETKAGLIVTLGATADSRTAVGQGILSWGVSRVADTVGNYYAVEYATDAVSGQPFDFVNPRVAAVRYTGNSSAGLAPYCHVLFDYETRPDTARAYSTYAGTRMTTRLAKIRVLTDSYVNHSYVLSYTTSYQTGRSLLTAVAKRANDNPSLSIPATTFSYDTLAEGQPLWAEPAESPVTLFNGETVNQANSMLNTEDGGATLCLSGVVSRRIPITGSNITVYPDSMVQFEIKSDRLDTSASIGFENPDEEEGTTLATVGQGGLAYQPSEGWKTFTAAIGIGSQTTDPAVVVENLNNTPASGLSTTRFRNIRVYRNGQSPASGQLVTFDPVTCLPRFSDATGNDLGVRFMDLNSDGLPDLADWRSTAFTPSGENVVSTTLGAVYRNAGGYFVRDDSLRPPASLPLAVRKLDATPFNWDKRHHLTARPMDVDGDGTVDLMGPANVKYIGYTLRNEYAFYSLSGGAWTEKAGWRLPFRIEAVTAGYPYGSLPRDQHFEWTDLNADGFPDLVVHTTSDGRLYDRVTNQLLIAGEGTTAFLNNGRTGTGWTHAPAYGLPEPLAKSMPYEQNMGRLLMDVDGDGLPEISEAVSDPPYAVRKTYRLLPSGTYRWNSAPGLANPPADVFNLPACVTSYYGTPTALTVADVNGDGMPDCFSTTNYYGINRSAWLNHGRRSASPWVAETLPANTGQEPASYAFPLPLHFPNGANWVPYGYEMADLNGDGLVDFLYSNGENTVTPGSDNLAVLNTGSGWLQRPAWGTPGGNLICNTAYEALAGYRRARLADVNGDGFPDLITGVLGDIPKVWLNQCRPEVLVSATDGFGSDLRVEYRRLNDPVPVAAPPGITPEQDACSAFRTRAYQKATGSLPTGHAAIIDARLVVTRHSEPDGSGGRRYQSRRYGDLRYDRANDASLGFGWIEVLDETSRQTTRTEMRRDFPFAGSPTLTQTSVTLTAGDLSPVLPGVTAGVKILTSETADYGELPSTSLTGGTIRRPVQIGSEKTLFNLNGNTIGRTTTDLHPSKAFVNGVLVVSEPDNDNNLSSDSHGYDRFGFSRYSKVGTLDGTTIETRNGYYHNETAWHLGRLKQSTITKSGTGNSSITRSTSFDYNDTTGLLESETVEANDAFPITKITEHDPFGNIKKVKSEGIANLLENGTYASQSRAATTTYDSRGRFPVSQANALTHTATSAYHSGRALVTSSTDANGRTTSFTYDDFGTLIMTHRPDGTKAAEITGYATNASLPSSVAAQLLQPVKWFRASQASGTAPARVYLDALGREVLAETTILRNAAASGQSRYSRAYVATRYDAMGRKFKISEPFAAGDTPLWTTVFYDVLSRVIKTVHPDGSVDQVLSFGTATPGNTPYTHSEAKNAAGQTLQRWEDQHGRLIQSVDDSGQTTSYTHDHDGRLTALHLGGQLLLTNGYDLLGNKTSVWEANSGTSTSTYNAFGETLTATNARGQTTSFTYDVLGRVLTTARPEGTFTTVYDTAPGAGIGQPWKTTGTNYKDEVSYDSQGRPIATSVTRSGETFATSTVYDALGRVFTSTDAGGLTTVHEYDPLYSFPTAARIGPGMSGAGSYLWKAGTFDAQGRALTQTLAHGVTLTTTPDNPTGRLLAQHASHPTLGTVQQKSYTWDTLGNLIGRGDSVNSTSESFAYDSLNRLSGATLTGSQGTSTAVYKYGVDSTSDDWRRGNLTSKPGATLAYNDPVHPHAVSSATVKGTARAYAYDAAGHVTSDGKRSYTWSSTGQLASLIYLNAPAIHQLGGTLVFAAASVRCDFIFDAAGSRSRQTKERTAPNDSRVIEETLYLGAYEREIHSTRASGTAPFVTTKTLHRHSLPGGAVYTRKVDATGTETRLAAVIRDHLGSTDVILTATWDNAQAVFATPQTERQSFDPWGERRSPFTLAAFRQADADPFRTSARDYDRGYTGHEQLDDSGLIHMNGRIYDPELGRMLSPDPVVQVPEYSQNHNRYSYVLNNPLNLTDPTGYSFLSDVFHKVGHWLREGWKQVVVFVVATVLTYFGVPPNLTYAICNGTSAALNGGSLGDVAKAAAMGFIQGQAGEMAAAKLGWAARTLAIATVAGATNEVMGGRFQDGFIDSIKMQAIMGTAKIAGKLLISRSTTEYMKGAGGVSLEDHLEMAAGGAYEAHDQMTKYGKINPGKVIPPNGWRLAGYYRNYKKSYLDYALFENQARHVRVMSFVGTQPDGGFKGDWWDNILQGLGLKSPQYMAAIDHALYQQAKARADGFAFVINGHSLGGGLASAAAAVTGAPAAIFNAAGLNPMTLRHAGYPEAISRMGRGVVHYGVGGEVLSGLEFTPLNLIAPVPAADHYYSYAPRIWSFSYADLSPIEWHRPPMSMRAIR